MYSGRASWKSRYIPNPSEQRKVGMGNGMAKVKGGRFGQQGKTSWKEWHGRRGLRWGRRGGTGAQPSAIETQEKQSLGFSFLICKPGASATQHPFPSEQGPSLWGASSTITCIEAVSGALSSLEAPSPPWGRLAPRVQGAGRPPRTGW